jgi:hypothetical protein
MPNPYKYSLRVVIQQMARGDSSAFRLVAYGSTLFLTHADFASLQSLVHTLRNAIPGFSEDDLSLSRSSNLGSHVIYTRDLELDYSQLSLLGLIRPG